MAKTPSRLGRGLSSLIGKPASETPEIPTDPAPEKVVSRETTLSDAHHVHDLPVERVHPNPDQPRTLFNEDRLKELAASLLQKGVLQPIVVRRVDDGFSIVAGERRWRAAQIAKLPTIPAIIRDLNDAEALEVALIENLQREDLAPLERASAYEKYLDSYHVTADQLAAKLGESRTNIINYLRLLRLPEEVRELLRIGELGMGQARAIAALQDPQRQLAVARMAVRRNLSVRQVEALAKGIVDEASAPINKRVTVEQVSQQRHAEELARAIGRTLGVNVRLKPGRKKNSGRIIIQYDSLEEFDQIADRLGVSTVD